MSILEAIILGIIQGLTEFLPISSTAHLTIAGKLFGLIDANASEQWTAFIAVTQLGTMFAVILYFYREVINIPKSFFSAAVFGLFLIFLFIIS
jgi:undecaprenyl-diphosphatase